MKRPALERWTLLLIASTTLAAACSSGGDMMTGTGGHGGTSAGAGTTGAAGTGSGTAGTTGSTGSAGTGGGFKNLGVCAQRGMATATPTTYDGYEEIVLLGDEGLGDPVCLVRFTVKRSGAAPSGCTDCSWAQQVQYTNPVTMVDMNGACANSELALDAAAIAKINNSKVGLGFAREYQGAHGSARMLYFDAMMKWDVSGNATWDETTNVFRYDYRDGLCGY